MNGSRTYLLVTGNRDIETLFLPSSALATTLAGQRTIQIPPCGPLCSRE